MKQQVVLSPEILSGIREIQENDFLIEVLDDVVSFLVDNTHSAGDERDLATETLDCVKSIRTARRLFQRICTNEEGGAA